MWATANDLMAEHLSEPTEMECYSLKIPIEFNAFYGIFFAFRNHFATHEIHN